MVIRSHKDLKAQNHRVKDTAKYFKVSAGLVSENLRLFEIYEKLSKFSSRNEAMKTLGPKRLG